ncbi:hypothetical protein [Pyrodictium abyssi]|uniref:Uncharacterized protein n=1 Tax=Pyrodictium abyssi TaxID=54256 RepID=A0ABM8J0F6_9CREN|nr:hypothetical protein PABY_18350 [Pyrodictium abyssi]
MRLRRVLLQADFILAQVARPVLVVAVSAAGLAAASMYSELIAVLFYTLYSLAYGLSAATSAAYSFAEEVVSRRAQLYLAAGLRRSEYALAWILAVIVYPAAAVFLSIVFPLLVLNPESLVEPLISPFSVARSTGRLGIGLVLAASYALTTLQLGSLAFMVSAFTLRRGAVAAAMLAATLLVPVSMLVIMVMTNGGGVEAVLTIMSLLSVQYALAMTDSNLPGIEDPETVFNVCLVQSLVSAAAYLLLGYLRASNMEY